MIIDQPIREQVLDVSQSFLVQAPAGSGKTSLLVQRFLSLLAAVQQEPEEIVALTFTRKAAAEMRARILEALELGEQTVPPTDAYNLKLWHLARKVLSRDQRANWELLLNPMRLKIQTIDSLCASITAQMPIVSRFGAQPQIETKIEELYNQAIKQLLAAEHDNEFWLPALNVLLGYLGNDREKFRSLMLNMLAKREQWLPLLYGQQHQQDLRQLLEASLAMLIEQTIQDLYECMPDIFDPFLFLQTELTDLNAWLRLADILLTFDDQWRKQVTVREGFLAPSSAKDKTEKELLKERKLAAEQILEQLNNYPEFKQRLIQLRQLPPAAYNEAQWTVIQGLLELLPVLIAQLTLVFKEHGQVDFSEVALTALRALGHADSPSELSLALDCKIQHILVDEFQDTSITQYKLLQHLTANWAAGDGKTLFLVGDPMQSIYRFRQAEVALFLQAKIHGINAIKLNFVQLQTNFRSTQPIVNWVNQVFAASFPKLDDMTLGAISYMPAQAADDSVYTQPVECLNVAANDEAALIAKLIQQNRAINIDQSIAILVRSKSQLREILPTLRAAGIEYQGLDIESLAERPLIQDLLSLTRAILHLEDRIAWLAVLRAPWCGLTLADLDLIANENSTILAALQNPSLIASLNADAQLRVKHLVACLLNALDNLGREPISNLIQNTWQQLGGMQCLRYAADNIEATAYFNLLANIEDQRKILQITYLEQQLANLYLPPLSTTTNPVQIMTMHKAKGLEFDLVILPSLHKATRGNEQQLLLLEQRACDHLLLAPIKAVTETKDAIYDYLAWCEKQRQHYDDLRLLYVAATRSRSKIYCLAELGTYTPRSNSMLGKIWPALASEFVNVTVDDLLEPVQSSSQAICRIPQAWFEANQIKPIVYNFVEKPTAILIQDWLRVSGIAMHRTLWQIVNEGIDVWDAARLQQQELIWEHSLRQQYIDEQYLTKAKQIIKQAINNMLNDPKGRKILAADYAQSYCEWPLTYYAYNEFKHIILDRVFLDNEGITWLIDYKLVLTDADIPAAIENYRAQLLRYASIVQKMHPAAKITSALYFPLQAKLCVLQKQELGSDFLITPY